MIKLSVYPLCNILAAIDRSSHETGKSKNVFLCYNENTTQLRGCPQDHNMNHRTRESCCFLFQVCCLVHHWQIQYMSVVGGEGGAPSIQSRKFSNCNKNGPCCSRTTWLITRCTNKLALSLTLLCAVTYLREPIFPQPIPCKPQQ